MFENLNETYDFALEKSESQPIKYFKPYIAEFAGQLADETKRAYLSDIRSFFNVESVYEVTIDMVRSVSPAMINKYAKKLVVDGASTSTVNRKLQALSKFYKYLCRKNVGIMDYNPVSTEEGAVRFKTRNYSNTRALTKDEVKKMMEALNEDKSIIGLRNKIIILLLATTGMRREEIANIKLSDFGIYNENHVIEFIGKGMKDRMVVVADIIMKYIEEYLSMRGLTLQSKNRYLFVSHTLVTYSRSYKETRPITTQTVYRVVKAVAKKAGLDASSIHPHCLRHTYITESLDAGIPMEVVQDRVSHISSSTTRRYDHTNKITKDNPANEWAEELDV